MSVQKKLAARILKCGTGRVWIDPKNKKVRQAITRSDIRGFIKDGIIKKLPPKKRGRVIIKKQQKTGSRKGSKGAREGKKTFWLKIVRPQRRMLRELKEAKKIDQRTYRMVYKMIKGNVFRSKHHLNLYLKERGLLKEKKAK